MSSTAKSFVVVFLLTLIISSFFCFSPGINSCYSMDSFIFSFHLRVILVLVNNHLTEKSPFVSSLDSYTKGPWTLHIIHVCHNHFLKRSHNILIEPSRCFTVGTVPYPLYSGISPLNVMCKLISKYIFFLIQPGYISSTYCIYDFLWINFKQALKHFFFQYWSLLYIVANVVECITCCFHVKTNANSSSLCGWSSAHGHIL